MFDPTEAVNGLCQLPKDELNKIQGIQKLRSLLKHNGDEGAKFVESILEQLPELQRFCKAKDAFAVVGEKPALDFRLVDIRFVDGKSRTQSPQANIRRVMGERSLASDFVAANPERLTIAIRDMTIRGKRNAGTIPSYVSQIFEAEVHDVVLSAIRHGLKLLVLEETLDMRHGLICIVALAHRQFERLSLHELSELLQSEELAGARQLATELAPLFSKAFDVYAAQADGPRAPPERHLNNLEKPLFPKAASEVNSTQTRKRGRNDTCPSRPLKAPKLPRATRKTKTMSAAPGTSKETSVEVTLSPSSQSHQGNFEDSNHNTQDPMPRVIPHDQNVPQASYSRARRPLQQDGSVAASTAHVDLLSANKPDKTPVREIDAETYQQEARRSFDNAPLQDEQVPSLLHGGHWNPELCSQDASNFAGCNESIALLPMFDVALDPSTYATSMLNFDMNSVNNILPPYNLDPVHSPSQFRFSSFAPLQR